jgi:signal transduction histidine kinase
MQLLLNLRLVLLTAGTLLPFFWMVVILGHRRQRNFERVFFFLCLALTLFFGSSLLALNAQLYYGTPPAALLRFAWTFLCLGLWFIPPLVVHLHAEYAALRGLIASRQQMLVWLATAYLPTVILSPNLIAALRLSLALDFDRPTHVLGMVFQLWFVTALAAAAYWQWRFSRVAPDGRQQSFHRNTFGILFALAVLLFGMAYLQRARGPAQGAALSTVLLVLALVPLGLLIGKVRRFNFLQIGRQRNLIYAVFGVFLALLYLSLVRRASLWLEPYLPPEASAAILLFLPVVFFEPLQRLIGRILQATAQQEMNLVYRLSAQIHVEARRGNLKALLGFIERRVKEEFEFEDAWMQILEPIVETPGEKRQARHGDESFSVYRPGRLNGVLTVRPHGAMLSGEAVAAMQFLCESIAGAIEMCIVLEEKLELERELAERERLALVGQMAASISHSLKNPLGSIKTILQVQMESPELPATMKQETQMVLDEIRRLSETLNQLLQFSRPGVRNRGAAGRCDAAKVAENVASMLRHQAENRGIALEVVMNRQPLEVAANAEVANDIFSNLVLNALEATSRGGHVLVSLGMHDGHCSVSVSDDGAGIPTALKEKILQPFFTTKARGTGLGLAIVSRRLEEIGGTLSVDSPIREEHGSRFRALLPLAAKDSR